MKASLIALIVILCGGLFGNYLRFVDREPNRPAEFATIPLESYGYYGDERRFAEASYDVLNADTTTLRLYRDANGVPYWLFVAYFSSQKQGSQIHSPKHCLPGGGWSIETIEPYTFHLSDGTAKEINRLVIGERRQRQIMLYWFETRGGAIRSEFGLKFDLMKNALLLRPTDAAFVRLTVPVPADGDIDAATERALSYLTAFHPHIVNALPFSA